VGLRAGLDVCEKSLPHRASRKFCMKIAIGGFIAKLRSALILNLDTRVYCKTGERRYLKLR
jgi:hypothetical protein